MDKWKVILILFLLGGLAGYGAYQQKAGTSAVSPPTPFTAPEITGNVIGKPARAWDIPAEFWMNTPQPVSLQDVKGHVTLVEFFRIRCSHCQEAAPFMNMLHQRYGPRGLRIVAFQSPGDAAAENNWSTVQDTIRRWKVTYPIAFDKDSALMKTYGKQVYPSVYVLDRQGIIRHHHTGHDDRSAAALEHTIIKMLGLGPKRSAGAPDLRAP